MPEIYLNKPEIHEVSFTIGSEEHQAGFVVGKSVDEIQDAIMAALITITGKNSTATPAPKPKQKRTRRTKEQLAAAKNHADQTHALPGSHSTTWPE